MVELRGGLWALGGIFLEAGEDDLLQRGGYGQLGAARRRERRLLHVGDDHGQRGVGLEDALTTDEPVRHAPEPVDVGAAIDVGLSQRQLRRHVGGRARRHTVRGQIRRASFKTPARFDETEVEHLDEVVVEAKAAGIDVGRLDIAMDQSALVGLGERMTRLSQKVDGTCRVDRSEPLDQHVEVQPLQQFHHVVECAFLGNAEVVHGDRMI